MGDHLLAAAAHTDCLDHKDLNHQLDQGKPDVQGVGVGRCDLVFRVDHIFVS